MNSPAQAKPAPRTVYCVTERDGKTFWTKIGFATDNPDGSQTIKLEALPMGGSIQIRDNAADEARDAATRARAMPAIPPARVAVKEIVVHQAEGLATDCVARTFTSWDAAELHCAGIRRSAPIGGSCYKTDFKITWQDGETYSGRYDATRTGGTLSRHVTDHCAFIARQWCPSHMTVADRDRFLDTCEARNPGLTESGRTLLARYDLGDAVPFRDTPPTEASKPALAVPAATVAAPTPARLANGTPVLTPSPAAAKGRKTVEHRNVQDMVRDSKNTHHADVTPGESIRIFGTNVQHHIANRRMTETGVQFDRTFHVGDVVEVDSFNVQYTGKILAIGPATVSVDRMGRTKRMKLPEFIRRNCLLDLAKIAKRNSEWMD